MFMLSGISSIVMLITFGFCYMATSSYLDNQLNTQIRDTNHALSIVMQEPIFAYDSELTNDILMSFVDYPHLLSISAYDHRGKPVGEAVDEKANKETHDIQKVKVDILWEGQENIGFVEASYLLDTNAALLSMAKWTLLALALFLIITLVAANLFVLSRFVISPLEQVTSALTEIAQGGGDLRSRLDIQSKDEMGKLGQVFDGFVSNLQTLIQGLVSTANKLEGCAHTIEIHALNNEQETQQQLSEIADVSVALNQMSIATEEVSNIAVQNL